VLFQTSSISSLFQPGLFKYEELILVGQPEAKINPQKRLAGNIEGNYIDRYFKF